MDMGRDKTWTQERKDINTDIDIAIDMDTGINTDMVTPTWT